MLVVCCARPSVLFASLLDQCSWAILSECPHCCARLYHSLPLALTAVHACTILYMFPHCLMSLCRYGENVEEAKQNPEWECPVCRDICNCSICRARKGWGPTGPLFHKVSLTVPYSAVNYS